MALRFSSILGGLVVAASIVGSATAAPIPYANKGTENPDVYTFMAANTGTLTAYFYAKSSAQFTETLGVLINGVPTGLTGLNNHTSNAGDSFNFGPVVKGDILTFFIDVDPSTTSPGHPYNLYSDPSRNPGTVNQVYSTSFAGSSLIPAGTYVGFEDENPSLRGFSDFNYQDEQFVFTNTISSVPLPASAPMFAAALLSLAGLGYAAKRKVKAAV